MEKDKRAIFVTRLASWAASGGLLVASLVVTTGCSGDDGSAAEGETCEVDADCQDGLRCRDAVCVAPSGSNNSGDAGQGDGATGEDGGVEPIEEEDYLISYVLEDTLGGSNRDLRVYSTADQSEQVVEVGGVDCSSGCWINRSATHFIYQKPTISGPTGSGDIAKIPLGAGLEPQGDDASAIVVAQGVTSVKVWGDLITYKRGGVAYYQRADASDEVELGSVEDGAWFVDAEADVSLLFDPVPATAQNLDIYLGNAQGGAEKVFQINSENYQEIGGSYYGQNIPAAVSPSGDIAALVTSGPNNYDACDDASQCSGSEKKCGYQGYCTRRELTVHFIEVARAGDLGMPCGGQGTCGEIHTCYQPNDTTDDAVCIPGRAVLGVPKSPERSPEPGQPAVDGCELSKDSLEDTPYTDLNGPFSFDSDGFFYGVGVRDCTERTGRGYANISQGDIIKVDPRAKTFERVYGNFGRTFVPDNGSNPDDPAACYDVDEQVLLPEQCAVYVDAARLSPGGNEFAFTATNMNVTDPSLAGATLDIWTVLANGEEVSWEGGHNQNKTVKTFEVHPLP